METTRENAREPRRRRPHRRRGSAGWSVSVSVLLGLSACRSTPEPPPFVGPEVTFEARAFTGPPLGGGAEPGPPPPPEAFAAVIVRGVATEAFSEDVLRPAAVEARLVSPLEGHDLLLPTPRRTSGVRFSADGDDVRALEEALEDGALGRTADLGLVRTAVAPGTTAGARLASRLLREAPSASAPIRDEIEVWVHRAGGGGGALEVGLVLAGVSAPAEEEARVARRELALFPLDSGEAAFVVPSPFADDTAAIVLTVRLDRTPPAAELAEHEAAVARTRDALMSSRSPEAPPPAPLPLWPGAREALAGLERPEQQRSALAYLAGRSSAEVAEEVALTGSDEIVDRVAREVVVELEEEGVPLFGAALTWLLEQAAYEGLIAAAKKGDVVAEAVLVRHCGELGRFPEVLFHAVRRADGAEALDHRVLTENRAYLTDLDPAARVRAYDWLVALGEAPEGFDPLGPREERRAALRRESEERDEVGADERAPDVGDAPEAGDE
ncbi:MAG: hypothetical protein ACF8XB_01935 [Planctomycetota bacterium JB042]